MQEWLENFELDLGDGTTIKPYDTGYAKRMAEKTGVTGTDEELIDMFGAGWWKHDPEAAEKLLIKPALRRRTTAGTSMVPSSQLKSATLLIQKLSPLARSGCLQPAAGVRPRLHHYFQEYCYLGR